MNKNELHLFNNKTSLAHTRFLLYYNCALRKVKLNEQIVDNILSDISNADLEIKLLWSQQIFYQQEVYF